MLRWPTSLGGTVYHTIHSLPRGLLLHALSCAMAVVGVLAPASAALAQTDQPLVTPIALEPFEHGFMLWRKDNGQITVAYTDIKTKVGDACQETYQATCTDQSYTPPTPPAGQSVPQMGFGWLYASDPALASHLGYALSDEVSVVAQNTSRTNSAGLEVQDYQLSSAVAAVPNPLTLSFTDQPGLTYCFPRGSENNAVLNTWVAMQRFDHGYMLWRQDS